MDFHSYSCAMDVSVPEPSFRILNWTCYHRPILYRIDVNKDTLHGCVILCNVSPLRCLVAWSNPNRFVYSIFFWCAFGFIQQLVCIFMIICVALSFTHNGTCISAIYIDIYIPYLYLLMFTFEMVFSSDKSLFVLPYFTHLIVSPCNRYTIIPLLSCFHNCDSLTEKTTHRYTREALSMPYVTMHIKQWPRQVTFGN